MTDSEGHIPTDSERAENYRKVHALPVSERFKLMLTPKEPDLLSLQLWLAKQLPEEIYIDESPREFWWKNITPQTYVTPCEWVEEKLTDSEYINYEISLSVLNGFKPDGRNGRLLISSTWTDRAIALMKVKGGEL